MPWRPGALELLDSLAAAQAMLRAGAFETAQKLLVTADEWSADDLHQATVNLFRAQITFASGHGARESALIT